MAPEAPSSKHQAPDPNRAPTLYAPTLSRLSTPLRRAFTLIELIGVLAILAIIAALLFPLVIKRVDRAAWTKEVTDLGAISNALTLQIIRSKNIPNQTTWAQAVGKWVSRPVSLITTTPRGFTRSFLIDPNLSLPGFSLAYTQTNNVGLTN